MCYRQDPVIDCAVRALPLFVNFMTQLQKMGCTAFAKTKGSTRRTVHTGAEFLKSLSKLVVLLCDCSRQLTE